MNINDITQAIATLGFPIVACAALFYQNWRISELHKEEVETLRAAQEGLSDRLVEAIQNNTIALTVLSTKFDVFGAGDGENI